MILIEKAKDGRVIPAKQSVNEFFHQDKKDIAVQIGKAIYHNANKKNLDKSIKLIHKSTDQISEFTKKISFGEKKEVSSFRWKKKNISFLKKLNLL